MTTANLAGDQLLSIVERIENLHAEKKTIEGDIAEIYAEAKGSGFDVKALKAIIRLRRLDPDERTEQDQILDTYMLAIQTAQRGRVGGTNVATRAGAREGPSASQG